MEVIVHRFARTLLPICVMMRKEANLSRALTTPEGSVHISLTESSQQHCQGGLGAILLAKGGQDYRKRTAGKRQGQEWVVVLSRSLSLLSGTGLVHGQNASPGLGLRVGPRNRLMFQNRRPSLEITETADLGKQREK